VTETAIGQTKAQIGFKRPINTDGQRDVFCVTVVTNIYANACPARSCIPASPHYDGEVVYGSHDGRGYEHCWSGDGTVPNSVGRLTINERVVPQMVARMLATAPPGADVSSWRY
jgi:hypothetical protein